MTALSSLKVIQRLQASWNGLSLKSVPVTFTFEARADSKLGEIPPGEDEPKDTAPVGKERRQGRSSGLPEPAGHA